MHTHYDSGQVFIGFGNFGWLIIQNVFIHNFFLFLAFSAHAWRFMHQVALQREMYGHNPHIA